MNSVRFCRLSALVALGFAVTPLTASFASPDATNSEGQYWSRGARDRAEGLVLVDNNGRLMGLYDRGAGQVLIKLANDELAGFSIKLIGYNQSGAALIDFLAPCCGVFFATADCSGTAYTNSFFYDFSPQNFVPDVTIVGDQFYLSQRFGTSAVDVTVRSQTVGRGNCEAVSSASSQSLFPLRGPTPISSLGFVAPFTTALM